jgi:hypothetical protein
MKTKSNFFYFLSIYDIKFSFLFVFRNTETRKSSSGDHQLFMSLPNSILNTSNDDSQQQNEEMIEKAVQKIYELKRFIENNAKDFKFDGST